MWGQQVWVTLATAFAAVSVTTSAAVAQATYLPEPVGSRQGSGQQPGQRPGQYPGQHLAQGMGLDVSEAQALEQRGQAFYEEQNFRDAIAQWQQATRLYAVRPAPRSVPRSVPEVEHSRLAQARLMGHISLAHQQLGEWNAAQSALETGRSLLEQVEPANPNPTKPKQTKQRRPSGQTRVGTAESVTDPAADPVTDPAADPVTDPVTGPVAIALEQTWANLLKTEAQLAKALGQTALERDRWRAAARRYARLGQPVEQWRCQLAYIAAGQTQVHPEVTLEQLAVLDQVSVPVSGQPLSLPVSLAAERRYQKAIAHWQLGQIDTAQALLRTLPIQTDAAVQARIQLLQGHLLQARGQSAAAKDAYQAALEYPDSATAALQALVHLQLSASTAVQAGATEVGEALQQYAIELQRQWSQTPPSLVQLRQRLALLQRWAMAGDFSGHLSGHLSGAATSAQLQSLTYQQIQQAYSLGSPEGIAAALATLAWVHAQGGAPEKALPLIREARSQLDAQRHLQTLSVSAPASPLAQPAFAALRYRLQSQAAQLQLVLLSRAVTAGSQLKVADKAADLAEPWHKAQAQLRQLRAAHRLRHESALQPVSEPAQWVRLERLYDRLLVLVQQPQFNSETVQGEIRAIASQIQHSNWTWQFQTLTWQSLR